MDLTILYRGPLSSCNYGCDYCPFAKHFETPAELEADRRGLLRFVLWCEENRHVTLSVFFTPWGEALIRSWYRNALIFLSHLPNIRRVAIQTNLSCRLDWLDAANRQTVGIWATFHPAQTSPEEFLAKCRQLSDRGIRYSVGVVGMKEHLPAAQLLRSQLSPDTYLWINAYKRDPDYYTPSLLEAFEAIDPCFPTNTHHHPSKGRPCRTGHSVISVDGDGTIRRCHFIKTPIGNLYDASFPECLLPRPCTNDTCGCHIGYIHMPDLKLYELYGEGILERIPARPFCTPAAAQVSTTS